MTEAPQISVVLPAYNEAAVIATTLRRTDAALTGAGIGDAEIIVVDDGSRDRTGDVAAAVGPQLTHTLRVLRHRRNRGYGGALRTGFDTARYDTIWLMDSDGQFDPADLGRLLAAFAQGTLVAGYRLQRNDPFIRRLNHAAFFGVVRVLFGRTVRDVNCAFKLIPRDVARGLTAGGAVISLELLLRAREQRVAVTEVGVPHHPRTTGQATGADPRVVVRAFAELFALRRRVRSRRTGR